MILVASSSRDQMLLTPHGYGMGNMAIMTCLSDCVCVLAAVSESPRGR